MVKNNLKIAIVLGIAFTFALAGMLGFFSTGTGKVVTSSKGKIVNFADNKTNCSGNTGTGAMCGIALDPSYPILADNKTNCGGNTSTGGICAISIDSSYPLL